MNGSKWGRGLKLNALVVGTMLLLSPLPFLHVDGDIFRIIFYGFPVGIVSYRWEVPNHYYIMSDDISRLHFSIFGLTISYFAIRFYVERESAVKIKQKTNGKICDKLEICENHTNLSSYIVPFVQIMIAH